MTDPTPRQYAVTDDNVIDLAMLFRVLWSGKWLIMGITFFAAATTIVVTLMMPNVYRAEALLAPNQNEGAGRLSSLASQYGGIASLAGINLAGSQDDKTSFGLEVLKSRKFISEFIKRHDLLVPLMASEGWDWKTGELKIDPDYYDTATRRWMRNSTPPKKPEPSMQEAVKKFEEGFSVAQDATTGFVTVSVEHYSPKIAKQWVDWIVHDLNSTIMRQDQLEAEQAIQYLNDKVATTSVSELRNVFFNLIEEQTKKVMLAQVSDEYVLRTVDPAIVPEEKIRPKRALIVIAMTLLGGFLGVVVQFVRPKTVAARQARSG
jgi:uncharacterized protein involved in exopolysaccharide biosynthesis